MTLRRSQLNAIIEDILEPSVYDQLVHEGYATELQGRSLQLNASIPRIVKRYEKAFDDLGLEFHKTRPARLFLTRMGHDPKAVMTALAVDRFERLVKDIEDRHNRNSARTTDPFH